MVQASKLTEGTILRFKDIHVSYENGGNEYQTYVDSSEHRVQCLHHSAVFKVPICLYVVAEWKKIIRVVICLYPMTVIEDHMELIAGI